MGDKRSKGDGRKEVKIPRWMFVDGDGEKILTGRFGLMCFSANRNKYDWER
jgi:hypothetical protein